MDNSHQSALFKSEGACADYFFNFRWPEGFVCPICGNRSYYRINTRRLPLFECRNCRRQTSLTVGTVMEGSRTSLCKWMAAFQLLSRTNRGTSAVELMRVIGVTYKTAWLLLHKIRNAIGQADAEIKLTGTVRLQASIYGRPYNSSIFRHPQEQPIIVGASMLNNEITEYVKIKTIERVHLRESMPTKWAASAFVSNHVTPGTQDIEWSNNRRSLVCRFNPLVDCAETAFRWLNTTFHGIGSKHLQAYLNEFSFRWNELYKSKNILYDLICVCFSYKTVTYRKLIQPSIPPRWNDFKYTYLLSKLVPLIPMPNVTGNNINLLVWPNNMTVGASLK